MGITRGVAQSAGSGRKNQKTINILLAENIIFFPSRDSGTTPLESHGSQAFKPAS